MSYALNTTQGSKLVHCSSRHVSFEPGALRTAFTVKLDQAIEPLPGNQMLVSLRSAQIPNTIYTVDSRNNHLIIKFGASIYTYTLNSGNYNVNTLTEHLQTLLGASTADQNSANAIAWTNQTVGSLTYTNGVHYDEITNKMHFAHPSQFVLDFSGSSTCRKVLGFTQTEHTSSGSPYEAKSDSIVDISGGSHLLQLKTKIMQGALLSNRNGGETDMIAAIPVNVPRNAMILYPPPGAPEPFKTVMTAPFVQGHFALADDDGVENIDLQGLDFNFTLQFDFVKDLKNGEDPNAVDPREKEAMQLSTLPQEVQDEIRAQKEAEDAHFLSLYYDQAPAPDAKHVQEGQGADVEGEVLPGALDEAAKRYGELLEEEKAKRLKGDTK